MRANMGELLRARMQAPAAGEGHSSSEPADVADPLAHTRRSRRRAIIATASLGVHGALVWLALSIPASAVVEEPPSANISVVDIAVSAPPTREQRPLLAAVSRPGTPRTPVRARGNDPSGLRGHGRPAVPLVTAPPIDDPFAELSIKYDGVDRGAPRPGGPADDGTGPGTGARGTGRGLGLDAPLGLGDGGSLRVPPPPPSQARPPRPKHDYSRWSFRSPQEYGGRTLLVELKIDASGEVSSVDLLEGVERRIDSRAIDTAYRFEFHPALDDAGRPIASRYRWQFVLDSLTEFGPSLKRGRTKEQFAGMRRSPP
jgi:hypothetical protein